MSIYSDKLAHVQVVINRWYSAAQMCTREDKQARRLVMTSYSDKLAHIQVVINCRYSEAQICTREDMLAHYFGALFSDDVMIHITLTTQENVPTNQITDFHKCPLFRSCQ